MPSYLSRLRNTLDGGHPVTGAFNANDATAASELNAVNISEDGGIDGMVEYLAINRSRTNDGTDTTSTSLLGRLIHVAELDVGANIFGRTGANDTQTLESKHAAMGFKTLLATPQLQTVNFIDTELDNAYTVLGPPGSGGVGVWKDPDITALKNLSQNVTTYALQQGLGTPSTADVTAARAL